MKSIAAIALGTLALALAAYGEDRGAPQPRLRIDPTSRAAVREPAAAASSTPTSAAQPLMLEKFVVKDRPVLQTGPAPLAEPTGKFTFAEGGVLKSTDHGAVRVEFGLWPARDILPNESKFKPPQTSVRMDFVRLSW